MRGLGTKRSRRVVAVVLVIVVAFSALTTRLFVLPDLNQPVHADAIIVLGGTGLAPVREGVRLAEEGYAPLLVFSLVPTEICIPSTPKVKVACFRANPQSTQGEARSIAKLAKADHLRRIIVVAPTPQATRARLRIGRCYPGQVLIEGVDPTGIPDWGYEITYEWAALMKALVLQRSC